MAFFAFYQFEELGLGGGEGGKGRGEVKGVFFRFFFEYILLCWEVRMRRGSFMSTMLAFTISLYYAMF